jgi:hypothetical protein
MDLKSSEILEIRLVCFFGKLEKKTRKKDYWQQAREKCRKFSGKTQQQAPTEKNLSMRDIKKKKVDIGQLMDFFRRHLTCALYYET